MLAVTKNNPSFDSRNYGFAKLGELMRKQPYLDVKDAPGGDGSAHVHILVRSKLGQAGTAA